MKNLITQNMKNPIKIWKTKNKVPQRKKRVFEKLSSTLAERSGSRLCCPAAVPLHVRSRWQTFFHFPLDLLLIPHLTFVWIWKSHFVHCQFFCGPSNLVVPWHYSLDVSEGHRVPAKCPRHDGSPNDVWSVKKRNLRMKNFINQNMKNPIKIWKAKNKVPQRKKWIFEKFIKYISGTERQPLVLPSGRSALRQITLADIFSFSSWLTSHSSFLTSPLFEFGKVILYIVNFFVDLAT